MDSTVDFFSFSGLIQQFESEIVEQLSDEIRIAQFVNGSSLRRFEHSFADFCGSTECIGVANGLDALSLSLEALGIGPGQEVIVPGFTFAATIFSVIRVGATPVPVEIDPETGGISIVAIESAITSRTTAIIPVHLHGVPAPMSRIWQIAERFGLRVVEDAAQAHGALVDGLPLGAGRSDAVCFSFYPTKNLGCLGDGGAVVTNSDTLATRIRQLGNYGSLTTKYSHEIVGGNSRLDTLQARFLCWGLDHLPKWNSERRRVADTYRDVLQQSDSLSCLHSQIPVEDSVWHHFVVTSPDRDEIRAALRLQGIGTEIHYPFSAYTLPAFEGIQGLGPSARGRLPNADELAQRTFSLPMHPWLVESDAIRVGEALNHIADRLYT